MARHTEATKAAKCTIYALSFNSECAALQALKAKRIQLVLTPELEVALYSCIESGLSFMDVLDNGLTTEQMIIAALKQSLPDFEIANDFFDACEGAASICAVEPFMQSEGFVELHFNLKAEGICVY